MPFNLELSLMAVLAGVALVAGIVRGFTGFGAGLIFMPVASALVGPRLAAPAFILVDFVLTLPLLVGTMRHCEPRTVLPAAIGALLVIPLGAAILAAGDPLLVRWAISILALALLGLMVSGWRYHGAPRPVSSFGVGAAAGLLSGIAQIPGPPIVAYWMAGPSAAAVIRANLICLFAILSIGSIAAYWFNGMFVAELSGVLIATGPAYALALFVGARAFGRASEAGFRWTAYAVIALAALVSLPPLDALLR